MVRSAFFPRIPHGRAKLIGVASPHQHRRFLRSKIAAVLALLAALLGLALALARPADAYIYWTNTNPDLGPGTIGRANLDGSGVNQSFISVASFPYGVAVNANHVYWANNDTGTIGRANLDGTDANQSFISIPSFPLGVAVNASHVYWTSDGTIGRANLDGSGVDQSLISTASFPWGVAVDASLV